jgi:hypothetical protein
MHVALAEDVRRSVPSPRLTEEAGTYLLGATAPDIRVLLRCDRRLTHFFDIYHYGEQSSVDAIFSAYPHLRDTSGLDDATVAFLSGYLTHLVMDEEWITTIYRPFFGIDSPLGGDARANVMDRVLQYELDRRNRADRDLVETARGRIEQAATAVTVDFLEQETLERWREVALDVISHPPDWERFRFIATRHLKGAGVESPEALETFLKDVPAILEETIEHVTDERLSAFMEAATQRARETVREYLR